MHATYVAIVSIYKHKNNIVRKYAHIRQWHEYVILIDLPWQLTALSEYIIGLNDAY